MVKFLDYLTKAKLSQMNSDTYIFTVKKIIENNNIAGIVIKQN